MSAHRLRLALVPFALLLATGALFAANAESRSTAPTARISLQTVNPPHLILHVGQPLTYAVLIYDSVHYQHYLPGVVSFRLRNGPRSVPLKAAAYKPSFWTGTSKIPRGMGGRAYVQAAVTSQGRSFTLYSMPFLIRGPVKNWFGGDKTVSGYQATTSLHGTILRPADSYVFASATSTPSQPLNMSWTVQCRKNGRTTSSSRNLSDGGPGTVQGGMVLEQVPTLLFADSCTIDLSARLSGSGSLDLQLDGSEVAP